MSEPIQRDEFLAVQQDLKDIRAAVESIGGIRVQVDSLKAETERILLGLESRIEALEAKGLDS